MCMHLYCPTLQKRSNGHFFQKCFFCLNVLQSSNAHAIKSAFLNDDWKWVFLTAKKKQRPPKNQKKSKILCKKEATSNFFKKNFAKKKQVLKMAFASFLQSFFWRKWTLLLSCKVFTWKYFSCCIYACWPSHLQTSALVFWPKGPGLYLDKHSQAWTSLPTAAPHVASIRLVGWLISHTGQAFAPGNWFKISPVCQHHWSVGLPTPGLLMLQPSHTCARHALLLQLVSWLFHVWPSLSKSAIQRQSIYQSHQSATYKESRSVCV